MERQDRPDVPVHRRQFLVVSSITAAMGMSSRVGEGQEAKPSPEAAGAHPSVLRDAYLLPDEADAEEGTIVMRRTEEVLRGPLKEQFGQADARAQFLSQIDQYKGEERKALLRALFVKAVNPSEALRVLLRMTEEEWPSDILRQSFEDGVRHVRKGVSSLGSKADRDVMKQQRAALAGGAISLCERMVQMPACEGSMLQMLGAVTQYLPGKELRERAGDVRGVAPQLPRIHDAVRAALQTLQKQPDDAHANWVAGYYYGFVVGNWEKALLLLQKGSGATLRDLAQRTTGAFQSPKASDLMSLAQEWQKYDTGSKSDAVLGVAVAGISHRCYQQALRAHPTNLERGEIVAMEKKIAAYVDAGKNVRVQRSIDVLQSVPLQNCTVMNGSWTSGRAPNGRTVWLSDRTMKKNEKNVLAIPLPDSFLEYGLTVGFAKLKGQHGPLVAFPIGQRLCFCVLDRNVGGTTMATGLLGIEGVIELMNSTAKSVYNAPLIRENVPYQVLIEVKKSEGGEKKMSVNVLLQQGNQSPVSILHWEGEPSETGESVIPELKNGKFIGLGSYAMSALRFDEVRIDPLSSSR